MIGQIRLVVLIPHAVAEWSKRPGKYDREREVPSTGIAHRFSVTHTQRDNVELVK